MMNRLRARFYLFLAIRHLHRVLQHMEWLRSQLGQVPEFDAWVRSSMRLHRWDQASKTLSILCAQWAFTAYPELRES